MPEVIDEDSKNFETFPTKIYTFPPSYLCTNVIRALMWGGPTLGPYPGGPHSIMNFRDMGTFQNFPNTHVNI